jgi:hypothetical protein
LGIYISKDLSWTLNTSTLVKTEQQRLYFLRRLKMARLSPKILVNLYRCTVESILTNCATVWFGGCSVDDRKALQRVMKTAQHITGAQLPAIVELQCKRCHIYARNGLPSYHQAGGTGTKRLRTVSFQLL